MSPDEESPLEHLALQVLSIGKMIQWSGATHCKHEGKITNYQADNLRRVKAQRSVTLFYSKSNVLDLV